MSSQVHISQEEDEVIFSHGSVECERFIRWVRNSASAQGKARDNDWMVDLAAGALGGDALRWYSRLDPAISDDWRSLQRALLERYAPEESPAHSPTIPAPASSSPPPSSSEGYRYGRIKIVGHPNGRCYVSNTLAPDGGGDVTGVGVCCFNPGEAMVVRYIPSSAPHAMEGKNSEEGWLGMQERSGGPIHTRKAGYAVIVLMTGPENTSSKTSLTIADRKYSFGSPHREVWNVGDLDGLIRASWPQDGGSRLVLSQSVVNGKRGVVSFTGNYESFSEIANAPVCETVSCLVWDRDKAIDILLQEVVI